MSKKLKEGYLQVYTGDCKGKTTAALGLAFRALGHGFKIHMIQFLKGKGTNKMSWSEYGEWIAARKFGNLFTIEPYGRPEFVNPKHPKQEDIELAKKGVERAIEIMNKNEVDILILDELNVAYMFNLITLEDIFRIIENKPRDMELIITGRGAPKELIEKADLVTEMKEIKHYYYKGVDAREGIEF